MRPTAVLRRLFALTALFALAACGARVAPLDGPPEPMGNFRLGYNIVKDDGAQIGPLSRRAEPDAWEVSLADAIDERLGGYDGEGLFHIGVGVNAYVLALPGVPLVVSPKSILIITVNVWDNATQEKLTEEGKQITVLESFSASTLVGSGLTQSKKVQMQNLSRNAAAAIQRYLLDNPAWFGLPDPEAPEDAEVPAQAEAPQEGLVEGEIVN